MKTNLRAGVYWPLVEALRRFTTFGQREPYNGKILRAMTGLGAPSYYSKAVEAGYMEPASSIVPRCNSWYRLTPKGALVISYWMGQGYQGECYPPREVPFVI